MWFFKNYFLLDQIEDQRIFFPLLNLLSGMEVSQQSSKRNLTSDRMALIQKINPQTTSPDTLRCFSEKHCSSGKWVYKAEKIYPECIHRLSQ